MLDKLDINEDIYEMAFYQVRGKIRDMIGWQIREQIRWEVEDLILEQLQESTERE